MVATPQCTGSASLQEISLGCRGMTTPEARAASKADTGGKLGRGPSGSCGPSGSEILRAWFWETWARQVAFLPRGSTLCLLSGTARLPTLLLSAPTPATWTRVIPAYAESPRSGREGVDEPAVGGWRDNEQASPNQMGNLQRRYPVSRPGLAVITAKGPV